MRTAERYYEFDKAYMNMALAVAELSRAERHHVGAIIVSKDDQIIAQGFNGTPAGFDNCCETKDADGNVVTVKECLHAETNAIAKCAMYGASTKGATLYVTLSPCIDCAKLIIQTGIKLVICLELYRNDEGIKLLSKAGITVAFLNMEAKSPAERYSIYNIYKDTYVPWFQISTRDKE